MRRTAFALVTLLVASASTVSHAQTVEDNFLVRNAGDLVKLCTSQSSDRLYTAAQNFCQGFTVGMYQVMVAEQSGRRIPLFCPPAQPPSRNDAIAQFVQWAQASPARLALPAAEGLASFLAERLPCRAGRSTS
jgi:hypothetical protein